MAGTFMTRLKRAFTHWRARQAEGRRAFPPQTLDAVAQAIAAGETRHRSELRLIVECALPSEAVWAGVDNRQRALALFAEYGVWDTEDNCGVLIYVNLADHKVDIVADRNVNRHIDAAAWQTVCNTMTAGYARGDFHNATLAALAQANALLEQHFPASGKPRGNELPDHPVLL